MLTSNQIKARLIERGIKILDIAKKANVSPTTVSIVLTGKGKSRRIQTVIARAIEIPYSKVWENNSKNDSGQAGMTKRHKRRAA